MEPVDMSDLPAAGGFRQRAFQPRELLSRTGSHFLSPPLHPAARNFFPQVPLDHKPEHNVMHLSRLPPDAHIKASEVCQFPAGQRAAGVGCMLQTAHTRGQFKTNTVSGQFANETVSAIPPGKLMNSLLRGTNSVVAPHQKATSAMRAHMEGSGQLNEHAIAAVKGS
eukprot:gnl/TRDRNA2_/TRDRNA2_38488_c0_seq1.p1 gnl/TRDRNA2_/TRDRNA2_38488_c0~~gnl/TRDRNA2_/TRDRNA2_38488_c0_seq1.p1  ORF type:complete len:167 (+),score=18.41 gnl/TRDRNA2_/TRDRNA2_38488_c0_seq1:113-613(+)